jgi:tripartite-type tricarboxylate transporter receptor subunit TctC
MHRKARAVMFVASLASFATLHVFAQSVEPYPSKAIRLVTPVAPGGTSDALSRILSDKLAKDVRQPVVVDNKPGVAGMIGTDFAAKSPPDGYTIVNVTSSHVVFKNLYKEVKFDALRDFEPVMLLARTPLTLVVANNLPVKTGQEFVAYAKANPGKMGYGTSGVGSAVHLAMEQFKQRSGIDLVHVPYKGGAPAMADLIGGNIPVVMSGLFTVSQAIRAGQIRSLFVTGARRSPLFPDIPTAAELGYAGFEANEWWAILAPAGTPRSVVDKLNTEITKVFRDPEVRARIDQLGIEFVGGTPAEARTFMRAEADRWEKVVKAAGIKPE